MRISPLASVRAAVVADGVLLIGDAAGLAYPRAAKASAPHRVGRWGLPADVLRASGCRTPMHAVVASVAGPRSQVRFPLLRVPDRPQAFIRLGLFPLRHLYPKPSADLAFRESGRQITRIRPAEHFAYGGADLLGRTMARGAHGLFGNRAQNTDLVSEIDGKASNVTRTGGRRRRRREARPRPSVRWQSSGGDGWCARRSRPPGGRCAG